MKFLDTKHKQKAAIVTSAIIAFLLFFIFSLGINYRYPPYEYGVVINLVDSNTEALADSGELFEPTTYFKGSTTDKSSKAINQEFQKDLLTDNISTISNAVLNNSSNIDSIKGNKKGIDFVVDKSTKEILNNLLKSNTNESSDDSYKLTDNNKIGDIGRNTDDNIAKDYRSLIVGSAQSYSLVGRYPLEKHIEKPDCNDEGIVSISIQVNSQGTVTKAVYKTKGSTTTAPCLVEPALIAAKKTTWTKNLEKPKQIGEIKYYFKNLE